MTSSKNKRPTTPFWYWSNWPDQGAEADERRTSIELLVPLDNKRLLHGRLNYGHGPIDPLQLPPIEADLQFSDQPEDCPWPVTSLFVISNRVREILEREAPSNCQFLPIKLWHHGIICDHTYWILYVEAFDCADQQGSEWCNGRITNPLIVAERVPSSVQIFRVLTNPSTGFADAAIVVRDGLRRILIRERVTGCFFYKPYQPHLT